MCIPFCRSLRWRDHVQCKLLSAARLAIGLVSSESFSSIIQFACICCKASLLLVDCRDTLSLFDEMSMLQEYVVIVDAESALRVDEEIL